MGERTDEVRVPSGADMDVDLAGKPLGAAVDDRSSEEIATEIEQTRTELGDTMDAIQRKLAPDRLVDDFLETVRDSLDRNSERILETMRQHPVVTSLVGLGVGWLLLQSTRRPTLQRSSAVAQYPYGDYDEYPSVSGRVGETGARVKESLKTGAAAARDKVEQLAAGAREQASHLAEQVREQTGYVADKAREQAGHMAGQVREQVGYMGTVAKDQARRTADRFGEMVHENPLAMAAVGLAIGAAIGLLIPETRKEEELMGEARDTLLDKAKATASDTMERVQRVAEAAKDAAKEEAKKEGLTSESASAGP